MKTQIYLLRHGQSELNKKGVYFGQLDSTLTNEGKKTILELKKLFKEEIEVVISSDLSRCLDSIKLFDLEKQTIKDRRLRELNFGVFEGLSYQEIKDNFPKESEAFFSEDINYVIPKGESIELLFKRVIEFFNELVQKYKGKTIFVSTHGGVIRALLSYVLTENSKAYWKFFIPHASLTKLIYEEDFTYLEYMGLTQKITEKK